MAGLERIDKCGFIIALGSGWVSHWGLTGERQATAVTRVCLCFACVSYEVLFSLRPVLDSYNPGFIGFGLWAVGLRSLVVGYQWLIQFVCSDYSMGEEWEGSVMVGYLWVALYWCGI